VRVPDRAIAELVRAPAALSVPGDVLAGAAATAALGAITAAADAKPPLSAGLAAWYAAGYGLAQARALARPDAGRMRAATGTGITVLPALQAALIARSGARKSSIASVIVATAAPAGRVLARRLSPT